MAARVTQVAIEALVGSSPHARVTQVSVETLAAGNPHARVSQIAVEGLVFQNPTGFITQAGVELTAQSTSSARITQFGLDTVSQTTSSARITQFGLELLSNPRIRLIPSVAKFLFTNSSGRSIPSDAIFTDSYKHIPSSASFAAVEFRPIFAYAELGLNRRIPSFGVFLGTRARGIAAFARFKNPGNIPCYASFWKPLHTYNINSDDLTKVYSLATKAMGGSLSSFAGFASAINAAPPLGWQLTTYDDSFWPFGLEANGLPIPLPIGDPAVKAFDFNWGWPNPTGDYSPTGDPLNDQVMMRKSFGLPTDPRIAQYTVGQLTTSATGIFNTNIYVTQINGNNLEFVENVSHPGGGLEQVWNIPPGVLVPGDNVIVMLYSTFIGGSVGARAGSFRLVLTYTPPTTGLSQIIG